MDSDVGKVTRVIIRIRKLKDRKGLKLHSAFINSAPPTNAHKSVNALSIFLVAIMRGLFPVHNHLQYHPHSLEL